MMALREDQLPPKDLWIGKADGEWPIYVFENEHLVIAFLEKPSNRTKRAWKITSYELGPQLTVIRNAPALVEVEE